MEVAQEYPDIALDFRYAEAAAHDLISDPGHFDVVLTENFLGEVLSDLGSATVGGLGMCPSGNISDHRGRPATPTRRTKTSATELSAMVSLVG